MTKSELSLLLFFETCAVDHAGCVDTRRMNAKDHEVARGWDAARFVLFGRISSENVSDRGAMWCKLSDDAWAAAHRERQTRAERLWGQRSWRTTDEKREAQP